MSSTTLASAPALALAALIRSCAVAAVEVVDAPLRRVEVINRAIDAVVQLAAARGLGGHAPRMTSWRTASRPVRCTACC